MRRKLFTLAAGVSAVLCAGVLTIGLLFGRTAEPDALINPKRGVSAGQSGIWLTAVRPVSPPVVGPLFSSPDNEAEDEWLNRVQADYDLGESRQWLGFRHGRLRDVSIEHVRWQLNGVKEYVVVPYWAILVATGVVPILWLSSASRRWIARRHDGRTAAGRCPACGYDLRATPGRCPECGAVPAAKGERA